LIHERAKRVGDSEEPLTGRRFEAVEGLDDAYQIRFATPHDDPANAILLTNH
jgi:hypothetical protein